MKHALMPENESNSRWERLQMLLSLLASRQAHAVSDLALQLNVSSRTLARDLKLLVGQGYEIESSSGPGGGVRLSSDSQLRPLPLRMAEAMELLLALAMCEQAGLGLFGQSASLRSKLSRLFAAEERQRIDSLRRRIRVASPANPALQTSPLRASQSLSKIICQAFFQQQLLQVEYTNANGDKRLRVIESQYLLVSTPFLYVIAWDRDLGAIRTFRNDRFLSAQPLGEGFALKAAAPFWAACMEVGAHV
jgi:predicted DNA-binding transcriptional regulator YafY